MIAFKNQFTYILAHINNELKIKTLIKKVG